MRVHITNLYGLYGTAGQVQNMVADIAKKYLQYNELDIYCYRGGDSPEMLRARIDGILASVGHEDIVILQHPVWNGIDFEETLLRHLSAYRGLKKIIFIHDVEPLMFNADDGMFNRYINLMIIYQAQPPSYKVPIHCTPANGQTESSCYVVC